MMALLFILAVLALFSVAMKFYLICSRSYFQAYVANSKAFYSVAEKLLKEKGISDELIDFLQFMAEKIDDKNAAKILYKIAVAHCRKPSKKKGGSFALLKPGIKGEERERIENLFRQVFKYWLTAIFNHSPFYARRFLTVMSASEKLIAKDTEQEWRHYSDNVYAH